MKTESRKVSMFTGGIESYRWLEIELMKQEKTENSCYNYEPQCVFGPDLALISSPSYLILY